MDTREETQFISVHGCCDFCHGTMDNCPYCRGSNHWHEVIETDTGRDVGLPANSRPMMLLAKVKADAMKNPKNYGICPICYKPAFRGGGTSPVYYHTSCIDRMRVLDGRAFPLLPRWESE